jgi:hypothetical protein
MRAAQSRTIPYDSAGVRRGRMVAQGTYVEPANRGGQFAVLLARDRAPEGLH